MDNGRVFNSLKNTKASLFFFFLSVLFSLLVRTAFINTLGAEYLGIEGFFSNIIALLSLTELGLAFSITFSLFQPLANKEFRRISAIMNYFKKSYIKISFLTFFLGISFTPFIDFFLNSPNIGIEIEFVYLFFLFDFCLTFLISHRKILLLADQKKFIVVKYQLVTKLIFTFFQIFVLFLTKNYYFYLLLHLLYNFIFHFLLILKTNKIYPYLSKFNNEKMALSDQNSLKKNVYASFLHNIGGVLVGGTDNLLITRFSGLIETGIYSNYLLIINTLNSFLSQLFNSISSSIGNLATSENNNKQYFIFETLFLTSFWVNTVFTLCLFFLINPFISIWIGDKYALSELAVLIISLNFYFSGMRRPVLIFKDSKGLFWYDRFKPVFESIVNLLTSIILGTFFGLAGVLIGTLITTLSTVFWIEPFVLFKYGFKQSSRPYFFGYFAKTIVFLSSLLGLHFVFNIFVFSNIFINIIFIAFTTLFLSNFYLFLLFKNNKNFKYILNIILKKLFLKSIT
jgi:O-antigen/teichoic acid export membrane protein